MDGQRGGGGIGRGENRVEEVERMEPVKNELQFKGSLGSNIDTDRVNTRHCIHL